MLQKFKKSYFILLLMFLLIPVNSFARQDTGNYDGEMVVCTMDVKICADGSYVGRIGADCRFAPCPDEKTDHEGEQQTQADDVCEQAQQAGLNVICNEGQGL